jgi:ABC-type spermidine/putrescine transport system permease subunit I
MITALPILAALAVFLIYPVIGLIHTSQSGPSGWHAYAEFFQNRVSRTAFLTTLKLGVIVTVATIAVSWIVAWQMAHSASRVWRIFLWVAALAPLVMGVIVKNYAFSIILQRNGIVNSALTGTGIASEPRDLMYTEFAVIVGMVYTMIPYGVLPMYLACRGVKQSLLDASAGMGAPRIYTTWRVIIPLTRQTAIAASALVFVITLGFYVTPILLGGAQSPFVASLVQDDIYVYNDLPAAAASSSILLISTLVALAVGWLLAGSSTLKRVIGSD